MECQLKYYGLKPYILAVPNLGDFFTSKLQNYKTSLLEHLSSLGVKAIILGFKRIFKL